VAILQSAIERKLSALLGAAVTFEKLNVSLIGGSIEAAGVRAGEFLNIAKLRAEIAVGRALKGEIVVKSLTIERPAVSIVRRSDGTTNLPARRAPGGGGSADEQDKTSWTFDVEKLLVVDGSVDVRWNGYEVASPRVLAQLTRDGDGYSLTVLAESVARRDRPIDVGTIGVTGRIDNAASLTTIADAGVHLQLHVGDMARVKFDSPKLRSLSGHLDFDGAIDLARLLALLGR